MMRLETNPDFAVEFPVAGLRMLKAIGEWREQLLQFPRRAER
jgi:hypothetical protein